jgi:hypothetical protein
MQSYDDAITISKEYYEKLLKYRDSYNGLLVSMHNQFEFNNNGRAVTANIEAIAETLKPLMEEVHRRIED